MENEKKEKDDLTVWFMELKNDSRKTGSKGFLFFLANTSFMFDILPHFSS